MVSYSWTASELAASSDLLALSVRIENSEIRNRVYPRAGAPLPASVVRSQISIYQCLHVVLPPKRRSVNFVATISAYETHFLPKPPIYHQIFDEVHCCDHSNTIVHPAHLVRLPHPSIHNWHTGSAVFPCLKVFFVGLP